jgi:hypothetical protein
MSEDQINIRESKQSRESRGRGEGGRGRNRRREKERGKIRQTNKKTVPCMAAHRRRRFFYW